MEDRIRRFSQSPVTHANHEDTLTNVRSMRSAINDGPSRMLTFGNTTRTHQRAEGPPRELTSLPLLTFRSLFARCERALWRHLLAIRKKENCTSRPRPIGTNTSTEATSSAEVTSILASTMRYVSSRREDDTYPCQDSTYQ